MGSESVQNISNPAMNTITAERIDELVDALTAGHDNAIGSLLERFAAEQPALHLYLMGPDKHMSRDEVELLIPASLIGWHILCETRGRPAEVPGEGIDVWLNRNAELFDAKIVKTPESEREPLMDIFAQFNDQTLLMDYLVQLILNRPEEYTGVIRPQALLPMILCMKTIIDCLIIPSPGTPGEVAGG